MLTRKKLKESDKNCINFETEAMTTDANMSAVAAKLAEQARGARSSTSIPPARASISVPDPKVSILVPAPHAEVPIAVEATLDAAKNVDVLPDSRSRVLTAQLKLANMSDEHDPHERRTQVHAALVEADAVSLSQRIVRASMITDAVPLTVFDKIIAKKVPALVVYEDDDVLAFHDIAPQAPVHIVIIPKMRDGLTGLSRAEDRHKQILGQLLYTASRVAKMEEGLRNGYRVVINEGGGAARRFCTCTCISSAAASWNGRPAEHRPSTMVSF